MKLFICACGTEFHLRYSKKKKNLSFVMVQYTMKNEFSVKAKPCDSHGIAAT